MGKRYPVDCKPCPDEATETKAIMRGSNPRSGHKAHCKHYIKTI